MNPYEALRNAIIIQACTDYRKAREIKDKRTMDEVERFFMSDYFQALSDIEPGFILRKLREEK